MRLESEWAEVLTFDASACDNFKKLKSLKNTASLVKIYRTLSAGAHGLSSPGSWMKPSIRIAFSPLQTLVIQVNSFHGDWKEIAADFESAGLDFYALFTGPEIRKPEDGN